LRSPDEFASDKHQTTVETHPVLSSRALFWSLVLPPSATISFQGGLHAANCSLTISYELAAALYLLLLFIGYLLDPRPPSGLYVIQAAWGDVSRLLSPHVKDPVE